MPKSKKSQEAVEPEPRPAHRPSSYKPEFAVQAEKLCKLGATDQDLADFFEVSTRTISRWRVEFDEFCQSLNTGKAPADEKVERSLYQKAVGYSFDAVKIFMPAGAPAPVVVPYTEHVPPDTTACIFWLKNRRSDVWRDAHKVEHSGSVTLENLVNTSFGAGEAVTESPDPKPTVN